MITININKELNGANGAMELNVELKIKEGEFVALSGKSGSGKTTLLRILAGLEDANGTISVSGKEWLTQTQKLPPQKREIGFVFQDYALFENMTVEQNLLYVANDKKLAAQLLEMCELTGLATRYPVTLSGGQKQRVSIARALMKQPKILLLDEPLSALDSQMRTKLQQEILELHKRFGTTTIMVSHDKSEIYRLASRVIVLESGTIKADGKVAEVFPKKQEQQRVSLEGEIVTLKKEHDDYLLSIAIAHQTLEVKLAAVEAQELQRGDKILLTLEAFTPKVIKR